MSPSGAVPSTAQVVPGACVNIVLKADQRTGRQVSGTVRDVLTRGDHHRGIKVRLVDGRIGRVQSLADPVAAQAVAAAAAAGDDQAAAILARDLQIQQQTRRRGPKYRDVREDDDALEAPPEQTDLSAYIVPARPRGKGKKAAAARSADDGSGSEPLRQHDVVSANVTCPVCNSFQGDEAAVAHHVAAHFE
ncbi:uncharacterized protein B0I36DRAFT_363321 [Microdochium trichocladiopsis]|uniref:UBZ4-type domain-containing protein n=1 Tax=Microdochium trichocladiopsis TaxID=1682393 RepID=A0A9P8Y7C1_9PEZI|nr:uncharacterized protein B0I36DRAFT_363321 [Microdochium trichocladiopsis]KAH7031661.1 hypothetical protein B0I36DRAFT_363321 [Microdochium trichocladiopsis]